MIDQRPVYIDSYSGSLTSSKKRDYVLSEHFDLCTSTVLMQLPKANLLHGPSHQQSNPRPSVEEEETNGKPHECVPPCNTFMGRSKVNHSSQGLTDFASTLVSFITFYALGTFGKTSWRPHNLHTGFGPPHVSHNGGTLQENLYISPDTVSIQDENGLVKDSSDSVYELPFDSARTDPTPQCRTST